MRLRILGLILAASVAALIAKQVPRPERIPFLDPPPRYAGPPVEWSQDVEAASRSCDRFTIEFYRQATDPTGGSCILSPFSIHAALSMTAAGTRGETLAQLQSVLHLPDAEAIAATGDLGRFYDQGKRPYELSVANGLWGQKGVAWNPDFVGLLGERFGGAFHDADFVRRAARETAAINAWVAARTRGKIGQILADPLEPDTRLVLANAVAFKGTWSRQFLTSRTHPAPFHRADGSEAPVPMMHQTEAFELAAPEGFQLLALPYRGRDLEMLVLLPEAPDGLPALESRLSPDALLEWRGQASLADVAVSLPRFTIEWEVEPKEVVAALGATDIFVPNVADCSGMFDARKSREKLFVSKVIHKAFIDVNEEGTEAAAATATVHEALSADMRKPLVFNADHPFLFLIRDRHHGTILFVGRYAGP